MGKYVFVGREVGILGCRVGWEDGTLGVTVRDDFLRVGLEVGLAVDFAEGLVDGCEDGVEGLLVGCREGCFDGCRVG